MLVPRLIYRHLTTSVGLGFVSFGEFVYLCAMNEKEERKNLMPVRITAVRQTVYRDLMEKYENPILHTCDISVGQTFISTDGKRPEGLCESAWQSMQPFVEALARGEGNFYDGWMKNPYSAMISCNDGFRPLSFYLETLKTKD